MRYFTKFASRCLRFSWLLILPFWSLSDLAGAADLDAQMAELRLYRLNEGAVAAPDFTVKGLDNKDLSLSDFKGSLVLLNFWATW